MLSSKKIDDSQISAENKENEAAITIQKHLRGLMARKKYGIRHSPPEKMTKHPTFVVGNDPAMPALSKLKEKNDKIALIATSGIRALSLACQLGNTKNLPKIILIDNSKLVYEFWYELREFMKDNEKTGTRELFFQHLPNFLNDQKHLYRKTKDNELLIKNSNRVKYLNQNIQVHFNTLFASFGYEHVRALILHTSLIKQSWADVDTFSKIKNILDYHHIKKNYIYASDIIATIPDTQIQDQILDNIQNMMPYLSIHTDYCQMHGLPEKTNLFKNQNPTIVKNSIFAYKYQENCFKDTPSVQVTEQNNIK